MRLIGRIFVIFFAFLFASLAAGITIAFGLLGSEWQFLARIRSPHAAAS